MNTKLKVMVVDDDRASTHCLVNRLNKMKQVDRVDTAGSAKELLEKYLPKRHYDIVYLDQLMPGMYGSEAAEIIKEKYPGVAVVIHSATNDMEEARRIFGAKPQGWLWKDFLCPDAELSVETIARGHKFYSAEAQAMLDKLLEEKTAARSAEQLEEKFTDRKAEVLTLYCKGFTYKQIGVKLFISKRTVETHMEEIHNNIKLKSRVDVVEYAMNHGYIPKF
ncbi:MAG: response regulator transcription factor [Bacteroidia bacterium]|nr:response regulator transcription factor [Bacteroidia bacterium]